LSLQRLTENVLFIKRFSVFYWVNYEFHDGSEERNKYIITLNCSVNEFPLTIILHTSKDDGAFYSNQKNLIDCVVIKTGESEFFTYKDNNTIVDLRNINTEDQSIIEAVLDEGELQFQGILEQELQDRITKAIKDSLTIEEYLTDKYLCR